MAAAGILSLSLNACQTETSLTESTKGVETAASGEQKAQGNGHETSVECREDNALITGSGAEEKDGVILITEAGSYTFTGTYQGQIQIDAGKEDEVELVLDGFSISSDTSAPVYGIQCKMLTITLKEGTQSTIHDAEEYQFSSAGEDEPDSPVFCKDDLVITGEGTLVVSGNYRHGIHSKDNLEILSGQILVTSKEDGVKGKDSVTIKGGVIEITSGEGGIKANNDKDEGKGNVTIEDGKIVIHAGDDGIHAESLLLINGGTIDIAESYEGLEGMQVEINGGTVNVTSSDDGINAAGGSYDTEEEKEMASMRNNENMHLRITGGKVTINAMADGIDSNGSVYIEGGTTIVYGPEAANEAALDYNGDALISGGDFAALGSGGMMQHFSEDSSQNSIMVYYDGDREAKTVISLTDEAGNELMSITAEKRFSCILLSTPELEAGKTYTVTTGDEKTEIEIVNTMTISGENSFRGMGGRGGEKRDAEGQGGRRGTGEPPERAGAEHRQNMPPEMPSGDGM